MGVPLSDYHEKRGYTEGDFPRGLGRVGIMSFRRRRVFTRTSDFDALSRVCALVEPSETRHTAPVIFFRPIRAWCENATFQKAQQALLADTFHLNDERLPPLD